MSGLASRALLIIFLLFSTLPAFAQRVEGYDVLGLARYCSTWLRAPNLPGVSTLMNTFGNPLPCIETKIKKNQGLKLVQVDLIDATCWRNRSCPAGVPKPTDLRMIEARAREVSVFANRYPEVEWWVSPALEHDEKNAATVVKMLQAAQKGCPKCKVINSPFSGATPAGWPVERHGTKVSAFATSGDGASMFDGDNRDQDGNRFNHTKSGSDQTYGWWNELNLRCTGEKSFVAPLKRTNRPTADQFTQAFLLFKDEPAPPAPPRQCRRVREVNGRAGEIVKTNAEAYCNGHPSAKDKRANRPLLIITKRGTRGQLLNVLSPAGKRIGSFKYWGTYEKPGTHRWYMGDASGQTPARLYRDAGGEWAFVELGGGECLRINTIRRMGTYR